MSKAKTRIVSESTLGKGSWNSKKFLDALNAMDFVAPQLTPLGPSDNTFGKYMAARAYGVPKSAELANLTGQSSDSWWKSALGDTFNWLSSAGTGVENIAQDVIERAKGDESWSSLPGAIGRDVGRTAVSALAPVQELAMIPGIKVPGESAYDKWEADQMQKFHVRNIDGKPQAIIGSTLLKELGLKPQNWADRAFVGTLGFGVDMLTDPITYTGLGAVGKIAGKGIDLGADALGLTAGKRLEELAAGLPSETPRANVVQPEIPTVLKAPAVAPVAEPTIGQAALKGSVPLPHEVPFTPENIRVTKPSATRTLPPYTIPEEVLTRAGKTSVERNLPALEQFSLPTSLVPKGKNLARSTEAINRLTKNLPDVIGKRGINPYVVERAVQNVGSKVPRYNPVAGATGHGLVHAKNVANQVAENLLLNGKKELTPARQTTLYNRLFNATANHPSVAKLFGGQIDSPEALAWRRQEALRQLVSAEKHLSDRGLPGTDFNGNNIRLSEVIGRFGNSVDPSDVLKAFQAPKGTTNAVVQDLIDQVTALRATETGGIAKIIYEGLSPKLNEALSTLPPTAFDKALKNASDSSYRMALSQGLTKAEASRVKDLIVQWTGHDEVGSWDINRVVALTTPKIAKAIARGETPAEAVGLIRKAVSLEVDKAMGKVNARTIADRVARFTTLNFTTWMGRGDYWEAMKSANSVVRDEAKARAEWFSDKAKNYKASEIRAAFNAVQNPSLREALDPRVSELADKFQSYFDNVLGLSDRKLASLKNVTDVNGSVAFRSALVMHDVNDSLRSIGNKFQFKKVKDGDWYTSWRNYSLDNDPHASPLLFMYNLDVAVHRTLAKYNIMDSFAESFGRKATDAGFDPSVHTISFPYGSRIDPEIKFSAQHVKPFAQLLEDYDKGPWIPKSPQMRMMTTGLRRWKSAVTIYYPSHHIRNLMGDSWLMWMSGINDPTVFNKAMKIMHSQRSRYVDVLKSDDINDVEDFLAGGFRQGGAERNIITRRGKVNISADEYYGAAKQRALLMDASRIEDLYGDTSLNLASDTAPGLAQRLARPLGGRGHAAASKISEAREHYVRLAHFVGFVEKNLSKGGLARKLAKETDPLRRDELLKPLFDEAARQVRKHHPDGTDMTHFEQKWMRNIIPFYSWSRKAIPLMIEGMFMQPAKILAYPRGMAALQYSLGMDTQGMWDPFPEDKLFPDWMYAGGIGPIGDPQSSNPWSRWFGKLGRNAIDPFGQETGDTIIDPGRLGIPFNSTIADLGGQNPGFGSVFSGLSNQLTPLISIPADLLRNRTETGSPISKSEGGEGYGSYALGQLPQTQFLQRFTGLGKDYQENIEPGPNYEALINMLTAAGITGSGKYQKTAEFQQKQRLQGK